MAQREVFGHGAAAGHTDQECDGDRHSRADEECAPRVRTQAVPGDGEHGRCTSPSRAGTALRGGGGFVHVARQGKDTVACRAARALD